MGNNNWKEKLRDFCPCGEKPVPDTRTVYVGNNNPHEEPLQQTQKFPSNQVISSKYTLWNFIPKNLWEQFHRIANFYFLCVACVEIFIDSPVSPMTTIAPLIFVIVVTAIKQGYEDFLRHKADREVNNREATVVREGIPITIKAMDIKVGDIVKVSRNQELASDMVMLASEDPDGSCYITTANLDGETSLKLFYSVPDTRHLMTEESYKDFYSYIECEQPVTDLYKFAGRINVPREDGITQTTPLAACNVLLRGSRLKNTSYVYGCTIYTGKDTKISLNSKNKSSKFSRVEKRMNMYLIAFLCFLLIYPALWVGLYYIFYGVGKNSNENRWYAVPEHDASVAVVLELYLAFMVLCNYMIPISMYVTIELQKFFGSLFFGWDLEMYDAISNEPAKANTSDLNEELGQVEYLFTDKTGTLTENIMQFRQCSVGGVKYVEKGDKLCLRPDINGVEPTPLPSIPADVEELLMVLALCHTVHVEKDDTLPANQMSLSGQEYDYQSSSPDEKAFVEACSRYNIIFHGMKDNQMLVTFYGKLKSYTLHHVLEFDPTRKRMSVIVTDEQGVHWLLVKGAETAILDRVVEGDVGVVNRHIMEYARLGLRTLCIANRKLSNAEFKEYDDMLSDARKSLLDRDEKLTIAFDKVEVNFKMVGATAVEDRLQEGVPETINAMRSAGIQVWVLTGDKEETAVNISYSAGHFHQNMTEVRLTQCFDQDEARRSLQNLQKILEDGLTDGTREHALVVDGASLSFALDYFREEFRDVCLGCVTVLCCRMSPIQKAEVVRLIKEAKGSPTTCAIGDGANDVSMIQEAHVGLGIYGKEGRQAVRCSDYAFGRFMFLRKALLVHGHYFYVRIATLVNYFFYKNVAMIMAHLYYTFFSAFSQQTLFEGFFLMWYNVTFTALPILLYGWFEQHIPQIDLYNQPTEYKSIRRNAELTMAQFIKWISLGLYHSIVFSFGVYFAFAPGNAPKDDGQMMGVYDAGALVMTICVITVNIKLMLVSYYYNWIVIFGFILTFVGYYILCFFHSAVLWTSFLESYNLYGTMAKILGNWNMWFVQFLLIVAALIPDILMRAYKDMTTDVYVQRRCKQKPPEPDTLSLQIAYIRQSDTVSISRSTQMLSG